MMRPVQFSLALIAACGCSAGAFVPDGGQLPDAAPPPVRSCATSFSFTPQGGAQSVALGGEWNKFDPTQTPMTGPDKGGAWHADVTLLPGSYGYKIVVDNNWILDPQNPYSKYVGGIENSVVEVDDCNDPQLKFIALSKSADGAMHAQVQYVDGAMAAGLDPGALMVTLDGAPAAMQSVDASGVIVVDSTGLAKDKHRLTLNAADRDGHAAAQLDIPFWIEDEPFDFRDGLLYFAFTDRFNNGNPQNDSAAPNVDPRANYEGGDFAGIQQKIESGYFDSLGVRTIWVSPPNANPDNGEVGTGGFQYSGYHGYWPIAPRDVQKRFGTLDDLKSLVKAAHKRGIRIIIDAVLNHLHQEHPYWLQHQTDGWFNPLTMNGQQCVCGTGPADGCGDWNSGAPNGNHGLIPRYSCWFEPYLPDLDYENWDALTTMIDDALFWAREADVDGFRVDAVKHFLAAATIRLRSKLHDSFEHAEPLYYLVGETFDGDRGLINSFIGPHALNAQFDFPLYFAVRETLCDYSGSLRDLESATAASDAAFGTAPMSPFLGNHDVTRFLSEAAGMLTSDPQGQAWSAPPGYPPDDSAYQKLQLALTFVATSPGVPLIYYGDELGTPGAADPDNRRFMKWDNYSASEQATLNHTKQLGAARAELNALRRGNRSTLWIDDDLYVYARVAGTDVAIVVINRNWNPRTVSVPVPNTIPLKEGTTLNDRLGGPSVTVTGGMLNLNLGGHTSQVLAP